MTGTDADARVNSDVAAIRDEYAEAAEAEVAEQSATLDVPLNLRIDQQLDAELKRQAAAAQIPTSALVRRILRQALDSADPHVLTVKEAEEIARRVLANAD